MSGYKHGRSHIEYGIQVRSSAVRTGCGGWMRGPTVIGCSYLGTGGPGLCVMDMDRYPLCLPGSVGIVRQGQYAQRRGSRLRRDRLAANILGMQLEMEVRVAIQSGAIHE
ncbi:hypothetical protein FGB62_153g06 [Gracilaria domingensis]|nr:hypothetical protein FGB62_153g06 [Gracilaria domingensis]